jgi:hypothetical protein
MVSEEMNSEEFVITNTAGPGATINNTINVHDRATPTIRRAPWLSPEEQRSGFIILVVAAAVIVIITLVKVWCVIVIIPMIVAWGFIKYQTELEETPKKELKEGRCGTRAEPSPQRRTASKV